MTRVKVCGITRLEDAELAVELGAWALGFILWRDSPRSVDPAVAAGIARAMRRKAELVGVFVDPTLDDVERAYEGIGLTHLQLHGDVGPRFCAEVARRTGCKVIRGFRVGTARDVTEAEGIFREVDFHLFDTRKKGMHGGTGETWDWSLAARRRSTIPLIASGGLTAENVHEAIEALDPYAVDVASGVEAEPGIKDPEKVRAFIEAASPVVDDPLEVEVPQ
jgi:phosphoribosylanthranilate isomerase